MRPAIFGSALFVTALCAAAAGASGIDGSRPLTCALAEAAECDEAAACVDVSPLQIDAPAEVRIDFAARELVSTDSQRKSPISAVEILEATLVLLGHQNGRGWTIVIDRATGHLTATIVDAMGSFVLAGGCTAQ